MTNINDTTNKRLKELIDECEVSRQVIAEAIDCDVSTVTKHYNGDRNITAEYIAKYATYFHVSADYLLGLSDAKTSNKDLQYFCEITGLSEEAICTLIICNSIGDEENNPNKFDVINAFFESCTSNTLFSRLTEYISKVKTQHKNYTDYFKTLDTYDNVTDAFDNYPISLEKEYKLALFEAQECITEFAKTQVEKELKELAIMLNS